MDENIHYLSAVSLEELKKESETLKTTTIPEIAHRIDEAKQQGDLSENAEYTEAKRQQSDNERRIMELENQIRTSQIASFVKGSGVVQMGSKVRLKFNGEEQLFDIVGSNEADPLGGKISNESPLGKALMGKKAGDKIMVQTPGGEKKYEILEVK